MPVAAGSAIPVFVRESPTIVQGTAAIPVYGFTDADLDRKIQGGADVPVYIVQDSELRQNGGNFVIDGRKAWMPVYAYSGSSRKVQAGPAIPIYIMGGQVASALDTYILTESGDMLITEAGDFLIQE